MVLTPARNSCKSLVCLPRHLRAAETCRSSSPRMVKVVSSGHSISSTRVQHQWVAARI